MSGSLIQIPVHCDHAGPLGAWSQRTHRRKEIKTKLSKTCTSNIRAGQRNTPVEDPSWLFRRRLGLAGVLARLSQMENRRKGSLYQRDTKLKIPWTNKFNFYQAMWYHNIAVTLCMHSIQGTSYHISNYRNIYSLVNRVNRFMEWWPVS